MKIKYNIQYESNSIKKLHVHMFWLYQLQHIMSPVSDLINASEMSVMWSLEAVTHMIHLAQSCIIIEFFEKGSDVHHAYCDGVIWR